MTDLPRKPRKKVTAKFSFPFIKNCLPIIAAAALVWTISSISFGIVFLYPVDVPTGVMIVLAIICAWVAVIVASRKGNQVRALVLLFFVSFFSGLGGWIHPLMIRVPIGCLIIIGLWWIYGYILHYIEHYSVLVGVLILLGMLVDLGLYWYILTEFFQENWVDWALYLMEAIFVYSALVYESFHVKENDIVDNRIWVVIKAILDMFIGFIIIVVILFLIAVAVEDFDVSDFSPSRPARMKNKKGKRPRLT